MPILYAAIGRRLGYPVKLATTKAHVFLRWESAAECFNLEATGRGMNRYDDEHYKQWPFTLTAEDITSGAYLKPLAPAEELALFLSLRGNCLKAAGRRQEAAEAYAQAARLAPQHPGYRALLADVDKGAPVGPALARLVMPEPAAPVRPPPVPTLQMNGSGSGIPADPNPLLRVRQQ